MKQKLYIVCVASDRMGGKDDVSFETDISGYPDTPFVSIYEARELTKKERKALAKQRKSE